MRWTRLSLFYLFTYLMLGGAGMLFAPELAVRLLGSTGAYPPAPLQFLGAFMIALSIIVLQTIRHRLDAMYPATLAARVVLVGTMVYLYAETRDSFFLVLTAIVGIGMTLTTLGFLADGKLARG